MSKLQIENMKAKAVLSLTSLDQAEEKVAAKVGLELQTRSSKCELFCGPIGHKYCCRG